jgi:integrase
MPKKWEVEFESEVEEYLSLKSPSTKHAYSNAFARFLEFYQGKYGKDANFGDFIDRIFEERKKPRREWKRIAETEASQFIDFLKDKGLSNNSIRMYFAAIQNFLKWKDVIISMSFINVPPPTEKKTNGKHEWEIEQIKKFVGEAKSYRDKAIITCIFQSGLAVNEICELNYGDVQDEFEAGILPLCLKLVRQKTSVEFKTFFGRDAVKYLKLYLATRGELKPEDPLFTKERARGGEERINTDLIEQIFSDIAQKVNFITVKENHYNPARPHSLRAAFNSRLITKIDKDLREFWMGHAIGGVAKAYLNMPTEEMRKLYMGVEQYLKLEMTSLEEKDETSKSKDLATVALEGKVKELEQRVKMHEEIFRNMTDMTFEQFSKWMQDKNRWAFQKQKEEDKKEARKVWENEK